MERVREAALIRGGAGEAETAREAYGVFLGVSKDKGKE